MIIYVSYYWGESTRGQYCKDFKEVEELVNKYQDISQGEYNHYELTIYTGKEEERVRKLSQSIEKMKKIECQVKKAKEECQCEACKNRRYWEVQAALAAVHLRLWKAISDTMDEGSSMSSKENSK